MAGGPSCLFASAGMGLSIDVLGLMSRARIRTVGRLLIWVLTFVASFSIGMGGIYWVVVSEIFPTRVRGAAMSMSVVFPGAGITWFRSSFRPCSRRLREMSSMYLRSCA